MTDYDETQHPRATDGTFTTKGQNPPEVTLGEPETVSFEESDGAWVAQLHEEHGVTPEQVAAELAAIESESAKIKETAASVGLEGIMPAIFEVIKDRGDVTDAQLLAVTGEDMEGFYEGHFARAVDRLEGRILEANPTAADGPAVTAETRAHLKKITEEAGLAGIMTPTLNIVIDREGVDDTAIRRLTPDDVTDYYFELVAPAIDTIERFVAENPDDSE